MKPVNILFSILIISYNSFAQQNSIPKEYQPIKEIYGDLNKDGKDEKVVVYNVSDKEVDMNGIDREIVIFKKEKEEWMIWHRSRNAIGNTRDGGMMGDPFEDIEIKKWSVINKRIRWKQLEVGSY